MLQQIELSIHRLMQQVDNTWAEFINELHKYSTRQLGIRYSKGPLRAYGPGIRSQLHEVPYLAQVAVLVS